MTSATLSSWRSLAKPIRVTRVPRGLDAAWAWTVGQAPRLRPRRTLLWRRSGEVATARVALETRSLEDLRHEAQTLRERFRRGRAGEVEHDRALAVVAEIARREMGLCPHREQIMGALALGSGCVAEMATGEGKTLTAALAATIAGWRGRGTHVITVNDYLAQRDAQWMRPVFDRCDVSVASIRADSSETDRRRAYAADVTYCTNKEVAADFLRDRLRLGARAAGNALGRELIDAIAGSSDDAGRLERRTPLQRGLACAIVDEADSVLIDEAVTPLIIAGADPQQEADDVYLHAAGVARELVQGRDFVVDPARREVRLTRAGRTIALERMGACSMAWGADRRREELVVQALTAREHYHLGAHYVIQDERIVIVDEFTGRLMTDRTWRDGMHQAVEAKENIRIRPPQVTLAGISFQRFFRLYDRLSGMTGTAREAAGDLWRTYRLPVVHVPPHRPVVRVQHADRVFADAQSKRIAVIQETLRLRAGGRPVLIGTRSVESSERISAALAEAQAPHNVLSAVRHAEEAKIIAAAGEASSVTVATNMAGRGTDIRLGSGVAQAGGLAVIATERHESRRIDRQLFGRAGRQGDPGSAQVFISLEDELVMRYAPRILRAILKRMLRDEARGSVLAAFARMVCLMAERRASASARRMRASVLRSDDWLDDSLGFAGRGM